MRRANLLAAAAICAVLAGTASDPAAATAQRGKAKLFSEGVRRVFGAGDEAGDAARAGRRSGPGRGDDPEAFGEGGGFVTDHAGDARTLHEAGGGEAWWRDRPLLTLGWLIASLFGVWAACGGLQKQSSAPLPGWAPLLLVPPAVAAVYQFGAGASAAWDGWGLFCVVPGVLEAALAGAVWAGAVGGPPLAGLYLYRCARQAAGASPPPPGRVTAEAPAPPTDAPAAPVAAVVPPPGRYRVLLPDSAETLAARFPDRVRAGEALPGGGRFFTVREGPGAVRLERTTPPQTRAAVREVLHALRAAAGTDSAGTDSAGTDSGGTDAGAPRKALRQAVRRAAHAVRRTEAALSVDAPTDAEDAAVLRARLVRIAGRFDGWVQAGDVLLSAEGSLSLKPGSR